MNDYLHIKRKKAEKRGRNAEKLAEWLLRLKGSRILATRYKTKAGEIDIIARRGTTLVFAEVKRRHDIHKAHESLTPRNLSRIQNASQIYIARHKWAYGKPFRYDAVFVLPRFKLVHIKDAWRPY